METEHLKFSVKDIEMKGVLERPLPQTKSMVLVLHPHPIYGGEMSNPVVTTLATTFQQFGLATFRFNFRGVYSPSQFTGVSGALEDTISAISMLEEQGIELIGIAGYSFGGSVALRFCSVKDVSFMISVSSSLALYQEGNYTLSNLSKITCPVLMVHGTSDLTVPYENMTQISSYISGSITQVPLENEGHFYHRSLSLLRDAVNVFLRNQGFSRSV